MDAVERKMERFARAIDRRTMLRATAGGIFTGVTWLMVGPAVKAAATGPCPNANETCSCDPPNGIYCTQWSSSYCSGYACAGGCSYWTGVYSDGCWCTKSCGTCQYCYSKCCDCTCSHNGSRQHCGCRKTYCSAALSSDCAEAAA